MYAAPVNLGDAVGVMLQGTKGVVLLEYCSGTCEWQDFFHTVLLLLFSGCTAQACL